MNQVVKFAIIVTEKDGGRILLPSYRFGRDARLACSRIIELESVESARLTETTVEEPSAEDEMAMVSRK